MERPQGDHCSAMDACEIIDGDTCTGPIHDEIGDLRGPALADVGHGEQSRTGNNGHREDETSILLPLSPT